MTRRRVILSSRQLIKIHHPGCRSTKTIDEENAFEVIIDFSQDLPLGTEYCDICRERLIQELFFTEGPLATDELNAAMEDLDRAMERLRDLLGN